MLLVLRRWGWEGGNEGQQSGVVDVTMDVEMDVWVVSVVVEEEHEAHKRHGPSLQSIA